MIGLGHAASQEASKQVNLEKRSKPDDLDFFFNSLEFWIAGV